MIRLLKSLLILTTALISLLVLITVGLYWWMQTDSARNRATEALSEETGMQWRIGDHAVRPDGLALKDVFVLDSDFGFSVVEARIDPEWGTFLRIEGEHVFKRVHLTDLSIDLTKQRLDQFGLIESTLKNVPPMEDAKWIAKIFLGLYLRQLKGLDLNVQFEELNATGELILPLNRKLEFTLKGEDVDFDTMTVESFTISEAKFF